MWFCCAGDPYMAIEFKKGEAKNISLSSYCHL
jgi:hypothetical protein